MNSAFAHLLPGFVVDDKNPLALALGQAHKVVGRTSPNPPVGAVVVKDGAVIAVGGTEPAGRRHAEVVALDALAPGAARGATLYVTLEPCAHFGRTPPCVDRVLAEGLSRVVVGAVDPNPKAHGGIAKLRAAGVDVVLPDDDVSRACLALLAPFTRAVVDKRAYVVLKVAASLDGRVAAASGASRWITGPQARGLVHRLRDAADAVVVGSGTVCADDPALTVRDVAGRDPRRVIIDGALRSPPSARVFGARSLVLHADAAPDRVQAFDEAAVERVAFAGRHVDLRAALGALCTRGMTTALVEAGPGLATALVLAGVVDELWWLAAPLWIGADGVPAVSALHLQAPADGPRFDVVQRAALGDDALIVLKPR